jgi:hypothetical protein
MRFLNTLPACKVEKRWGGPRGNAGKPDLTGCINGKRFEFEVKRPGITKATELQEKELRDWEAAGAIVGVVNSVDGVKKILREHGFLV